MHAPVQSKRSYRFGLFEADLVSGELLRQGARVRLQDQPFRVLTILLDRAGEVVSREELRQRLWPADTYVEFDGSLNAALKKLRSALGDSADNPIFIETVPKRGYRFIAPVIHDQDAELAGAAEQPATFESSEPLDASREPWFIARRRGFWWVLAPLLILVVLAAWRYSGRSRSNPPAVPNVIAVLPFSNEGAGADLDYLRYAIANDLVSDLTYTHSVAVRPFAATSRYGLQPADPASVGKELRVTHVVAGGFLLDKQTLRVNLELVDVALNQVVWRTEVTASPQELVALHDRLAVSAAKGLLPAMNISSADPNEMPTPRNEKALGLFLHSLTIPLDPEPNQVAIKNLEESVSLDSGYAPAWEELSWRYYIDARYGRGGNASLEKGLHALHRAELDPHSTANTITIQVEQGDLNGAYDDAVEHLRRWPDVGGLHYEMSYVLRYAGLLEEAGKECDKALAIDPGYSAFRSCAIPFILANDYAHAVVYIRLDENSGFGAASRMRIALRTRNTAGLLAESGIARQTGFRFADVVRGCVNRAPEAELSKAAAELEADPIAAQDPEVLYVNAEALSFCGFGDAALRQLRKAIAGNYCSYPAMEKDPLFDPLRHRPEFGELRQAGIKCQESFQAHRQQVSAAIPERPEKLN
jgi:DNA-binding winged helix-turn-helix (wHTH) protein/TolB-like protein